MSEVTVPTESARSTVYGPVRSWRVGMSLGIDVLFESSVCSFRCIYCQLGQIETPTRQRSVWVPTERILADLARHDWQSADIITFSGSGEPTLALNLGEIIRGVRALTGKPILVLTNATTLDDPAVRSDIALADRVYAKLDAATEEAFQRIDRPVDGVTLGRVVAGLATFRESYRGLLGIQTMFMPANRRELDALVDIYLRIRPDEIQLNTPTRPVPRRWFLDARGNYDVAPFPAVPLRHLDREEATEIEEILRARTGLRVISVFRPDDRQEDR